MIQNLVFLIRLKLKVKSAKHLACVPPKNDPTFKISAMYTRNLCRAGIQLSDTRFIPRILEYPTFGLTGPIKSTSKLSEKYTKEEEGKYMFYKLKIVFPYIVSSDLRLKLDFHKLFTGALRFS